MNTKKNHQYQETHLKIQKALTQLLLGKELPHISVLQICDLAKINPSTFYVHYKDIYDLSEQLERQIQLEHKELFDNAGIGTGRFLELKGLILLLKYIQQNRDFSLTHFKSNNKNATKIMFDEIWKYQNDFHIWDFGPEDKNEIQYLFYLFFSGYLSVVQLWLENDCKEAPEEMAALIYKQLPDRFRITSDIY